MSSDDDKKGSPEILPTEIAPSRPTPPVEADRLDVGAVVGDRYRIDGVLGAGGMGEVYRAHDLRLERHVALKTVRRHLLANPTMIERFRREAVAVARLRHPNIVTVHDYGVAPDEGAFLVMELLEGRTLRHELLERGRLDPRLAAHFARQICRAVGAAHREGVVHRDLKPENVFLETRAGVTSVKVVDFGLAKLEAVLAEDDPGLTVDDVVFGTPIYMSPEQCAGEDADARSDVYALGCILFEMLTGRPPFIARPLAALLFHHVNVAPPSPSEIVPGLSSVLDAAVLRALAKSPDDRYQRAEELERDLAADGGGSFADDALPDSTSERAATTRPTPDAIVPARMRGNLPLSTSRFVGRERQIDEVRDRLGATRLLTLTGPGGIGKTRLALEVAARAGSGFDGGVWLVELAAVTDPARVADAALAALDVREASGARPLDAVTEAIGERATLVVLDNCEHLIEASARFVDAVLRTCPHAHVLATSREPLAVAGEAVWPVPALTLPDEEGDPTPETLAEWESTRLFVERAALVRAGFEVAPRDARAVVEICRRLDGLPLAVELAAACAKVLSVAEIAVRLEDRFRLLTGGSRTAPLRHQTLRAAIAWSRDLLADEERALLRRLSVFAGGFTLRDVEEVCGADGTLDALSRLVDASLVVADSRADGSTRYRMYESVRELAVETLATAGETDVYGARHRDHFLALAERAADELTGPDQIAWARRLDDEHDNLRAALRRTVDVEADAELALRSACALGRFWSVRAHITEGRSWLERVLALSHRDDNPLLPWAIIWSAQLARLQRDLPVAIGFANDALVLAERAGDRRAVGVACHELLNAEVVAGDFAAASEHGERALAAFEELDDRRSVALASSALGTLAAELGEYDRAVDRFERALPTLRELGDARNTSTILNNLGRLLAMRGDTERARVMVEEGLGIATDLGDRTAIGFFTFSLGLISAMENEHDTAIARFVDALEEYRTMEAEASAIEVAESIATSALALGRTARAVRLVGAADAARQAGGHERSPADAIEIEAGLATARETFGAETVERLLAKGRESSIDAAVAAAVAHVR